MIRPAKFADIIRIRELMIQLHCKSIYRDIDEVDPDECRALFMRAIQRHGAKTDGGSLVLVSEYEGQVEGFMLGMLDRVYHVGKKLCANDVYLYQSARADPRDMLRLLDAYIEWAETNPNVVVTKLSWTDATADGERAGKIYERRGFRKSGAIYERIKEK